MRRFFIIFFISIFLSTIAIAKSTFSRKTKLDLSISIDNTDESIKSIEVHSDEKAFHELIERQLALEELEKDFEEMQKNFEELETNLAQVQRSINKAEMNLHHISRETANLEASPAELNKYISKKIDVAETEYEGGVPYQLDIFDHARKLYYKNSDVKRKFLSL